MPNHYNDFWYHWIHYSSNIIATNQHNKVMICSKSLVINMNAIITTETGDPLFLEQKEKKIWIFVFSNSEHKCSEWQ